jgi:hypothetical protein
LNDHGIPTLSEVPEDSITPPVQPVTTDTKGEFNYKHLRKFMADKSK